MVLIGSIGGVMRFVSYLLDGDAALTLGLIDDDRPAGPAERLLPRAQTTRGSETDETSA